MIIQCRNTLMTSWCIDKTIEKKKPITMYIKNSRDSSKFRGCSPLQLHRKLKDLSSAVGYYSYTHRYSAFKESGYNKRNIN